MEIKTLDEFGQLYLTDKSSIVHDYLRKYTKYFPFKRDENLKILEIGVQGGNSLKTWQDYYYNSVIVGIDIETYCKQFESERIKVEIGSQFDGEFLKEVAEKHGPFDLILDDGSHINEHVIFSFKELFNYVKPQGLYVVEDVVTSYWPYYNGSLTAPNTMVSYFKTLIDEVNFYGEELEYPLSELVGKHARKDLPLIKQLQNKGVNRIGFDIESINFLNSIIIINKR